MLKDKIVKALGKLALAETKNLTRSIMRTQLKKQAGRFLDNWIAKSPETLTREAREKIGFDTIHFTEKDNEVVFKNSPALIAEWVAKSPATKDRVIRDEETGALYFDNYKLENTKIRELSDEFIKATDIQSVGVYGSFERVVRNLDPQDITARNFRHDFSGWNPAGVSMIDIWLEKCFGEAIDTDLTYAKLLFKKWVVGTARRAIQPGSSLDGCLTLQGPPGVGKTRFFREILPPPFDVRSGEIFCKDIKNPQKFIEAIIGKTVACFDELSVLQNDKVEAVFKQLLSSQNIDVRLAWARVPKRYALRQGFSATSNPEKFIRDPALNRRLWVIKLNDKRRLDFDFVWGNRVALWQEAVHLAQTDFSVHLSYDEQKEVEAYNQRFAV